MDEADLLLARHHAISAAARACGIVVRLLRGSGHGSAIAGAANEAQGMDAFHSLPPRDQSGVQAFADPCVPRLRKQAALTEQRGGDMRGAVLAPQTRKLFRQWIIHRSRILPRT